jgi:hypothetical protein
MNSVTEELNTPSLVPRLLTRKQAMAYLALGTASFKAWIEQGLIPGPLTGTRRWDRLAIDAALNRASGLNATTNMSSLDQWRFKRDAGSPSRLVRDL